MNGYSGEAVLALSGVVKEFPEPQGMLRILHGLSLTVRRGETVMIMGPSGSGKTTLLQIAGCLIRPSAGRVEIAGTDVTGTSEAERLQVRRRHLGFVFQNFHLLDALSAYDNVALMLHLRGQPIERDRILGLLESVGLAQKAGKSPAQLSGGEKQRVALARGLASAPDVLLADEPTSQLDSHSAALVSRLLRDLAVRSNTAVLLATHDPRLGAIADRCLTLHEGLLHA